MCAQCQAFTKRRLCQIRYQVIVAERFGASWPVHDKLSTIQTPCVKIRSHLIGTVKNICKIPGSTQHQLTRSCLIKYENL